MNQAVVTILVALIGSGALTGFVTWIANRRSSDANATAIIVSTSTSLLEPMRAEIERLHDLVISLEATVEALKKETEECHRDRAADNARLRVLEAQFLTRPPKEQT